MQMPPLDTIRVSGMASGELFVSVQVVIAIYYKRAVNKCRRNLRSYCRDNWKRQETAATRSGCEWRGGCTRMFSYHGKLREWHASTHTCARLTKK